jgi:hypothetical protein
LFDGWSLGRLRCDGGAWFRGSRRHGFDGQFVDQRLDRSLLFFDRLLELIEFGVLLFEFSFKVPDSFGDIWFGLRVGGCESKHENG